MKNFYKLPSIRIASLAFACLSPLTMGAEFVEVEKREAPESRRKLNQQRLKRYDFNKNGKLDKLEIEKIGRDRRMKRDLNKDGRLDAEELRKAGVRYRRMPKQDKVQKAMAKAKGLEAERKQVERKRRANAGGQAGKAGK